MGIPVSPVPVKLFTGVLYSDTETLDNARRILESRFGKIDTVSPPFDFDLTNYYEKEMGPKLIRLFWSFERLIDPSELPDVKVFTNSVEMSFSEAGNRKINLDPGYMDFHKVVLASVKERAQKIYLGKGIYADPTLYYLKGAFHPYDWSLPDFKDTTYYAVFREMRNRYRETLRRKT